MRRSGDKATSPHANPAAIGRFQTGTKVTVIHASAGRKRRRRGMRGLAQAYFTWAGGVPIGKAMVTKPAVPSGRFLAPNSWKTLSVSDTGVSAILKL